MDALKRWRGLRRQAILLAIAWLTLGSSACNKSSIKLYPVRGQVFYKNQPATSAQIVLQPQEQSGAGDAKAPQPMAHGTVGADGSFALRTEPYGEGAVPGNYNVLITWYDTNPKDPEKPINKLPLKYADQSKPAIQVTVKEEKNELTPFKLN
jgi:hypothetical protein